MKACGAYHAARRRHLAAQARRDALALLRTGETVVVSAYDDTSARPRGLPRAVRVRPFAAGEPHGGQLVLALHNQRLRVMWFIDKDGQSVADNGRRHAVHPPYKDVFGVVLLP